MLDHPSVRQSNIPLVCISFLDDNLSKHNGFSPNLVCALILWRPSFELLLGKFHQILMELSAQDMFIFLFPGDNLCKCQGSLIKLGTCIDIKEIWFGIANGQISSMFDRVICPRHNSVGVLKLNIFIFIFFCNMCKTSSEGKQNEINKIVVILFPLEKQSEIKLS